MNSLKTTSIIFTIIFSFFISLAGQAQEINLLEFNFDNQDKRDLICDCHQRFAKNPYLADRGSNENKNNAFISIVGAKFNGFVDGYSTGKAVSSEDWQEDSNSKYWQITISTLGYESLNLSSRQRSSNTGPRDFEVQWSLDQENWTKVDGSEITVKNNWTSGVLNNLPLPSEIDNQETVYLRWLVTSNIRVDDSDGEKDISPDGTSRIDDIQVSLSSLAAWDFENEDRLNNGLPYLADQGVFKNTSEITLIGSSPNNSVNGYTGKAISSKSWQEGVGSKYWQITISTLGYENLRLSSRQRGSNTGPRDFEVQWSLDQENWTKVDGSEITVKNNWTSGVLNNLPLPSEIDNQKNVYLRWIVTSDISVNDGIVASGGTNHIDDIVIDGCSGIACWDFEDEDKIKIITDSNTSLTLNPYTADDGVANNKNRATIGLVGARFNNFGAANDGYTATSEDWHNHGQTIPKYWFITFSSLGYQDLSLFSKQRSSPAGPRDFKVEWSLDQNTWKEVANSEITISNNWTSGALDNLPLPNEIDNQETVYLRWLVTSNIRVDDSDGEKDISPDGTNRIDDIIVQAQPWEKPSTNSSSSLPPAAYIPPSTTAIQSTLKTELAINNDGLIELDLTKASQDHQITGYALSSSLDFSLAPLINIDTNDPKIIYSIHTDQNIDLKNIQQFYLRLYNAWGRSTDPIIINISPQDSPINKNDNNIPGNTNDSLITDKEVTENTNTSLVNRLSGYMLLQSEANGETWYLNPLNNRRYLLGRPDDAFRIMQELSLGISEINFTKFNNLSAPKHLSGYILLRPEANGETYYVNPADLKLHYLGRPDDAFRIMQKLSLGISNDDLNKIKINN